MTVIYSNFGDADTLALPGIWENIPNVNVIEITKDTVDFDETVNNAIWQETDTIIFCGHGTSHGLLHPNMFGYVFDNLNRNFLKAKNVIGIWCWASDFAREMKLNGFFSSMYISNISEAYRYGFTEALATDINDSLKAFCKKINQFLLDNVPLNEWVNKLHSTMNKNNLVEEYNYNGLTFLDSRICQLPTTKSSGLAITT